jgi:hypothetical protein
MQTQIVYQLLVQGISISINWNGEYSYIQRFFPEFEYQYIALLSIS